MGDKTGIEWTDATWNPVTGCDRISPGCDHCYALTLAARLKRMGSANYQNDGDPRTSGPGFRVTCHPHMLDQPLRWRRPRRIFVNSMSDLFHEDVPDSFIADVFARMALARRHTFQVLTKRPQRMARLAAQQSFWQEVEETATEILCRTSSYDQWTIELDDWRPRPDGQGSNIWCPPWPLPNVWLGTSIESDKYTFRADHLRNAPAAVRFLSLEPLLGPLPSLDLTDIDWVIAGGESGPGARPMHPDWVRDIRDRCLDRREPCEIPDVPLPHSVGVPGGGRACLCEYPDPVAFHFKQWGEWAPTSARVGKKAAGRELDGRTWDEYPCPEATP